MQRYLTKTKGMKGFCWIYFPSYRTYNLHLSVFPILSRSKLKILDVQLYEKSDQSDENVLLGIFFPQSNSFLVLISPRE